MKRDVEKIFEGINEQRIISFHYDEKGFYRMIHPYYVFNYNKKTYLIGFAKEENIVKTYKVDKITNVEITSLHYSEATKNNINSYLNPRYFKPNGVQKVINVHNALHEPSFDTKESGNKRDDKLTRLMEYYEKSLKQEQLMSLTLETTHNPNNFYKINSSLCESIINMDTTAFELDYRFKKIYTDWEKLIKKEPELSIYLGYPLIKIQGKQFPMMFFPMTYDNTTNTIKKSKNDVVINGKFTQDIIELSAKEASQMKDYIFSHKEGELPKLNPNFTSLTRGYETLDHGVLFLQSNNIATKGLLHELKKISQQGLDSLRHPFHFLINGEVPQALAAEEAKNQLTVVPCNESQKEVLTGSSNILSLVHGPPGTGKTQTIVNLIVNEVYKGNNVLVTSTNNKSVDNIHDKLKQGGIFEGVLRLGSKEKRTEAVEGLKHRLSVEAPFDKDAYHHIATKSERIHHKIENQEAVLSKIKILEEKEKQIDTALTLQKNAIIRQGINYKQTLNQLHFKTYNKEEVVSVIRDLNILSVRCEKQDVNRNHWMWKLLKWFQFDYDSYYLKKNLSSLTSLGITLNNQSYFDLISEFAIEINHLIMALQYKLIYIEKQKVAKQLEPLNKDTIYSEMHALVEEKRHVDNNLMHQIHARNLRKFTEEDKRGIVDYFTQNEAAFGRPSKQLSMLFDMFPVVLSTNFSIPSTSPFNETFDLVIIDEASQCTIPSSIPAIYRAKRLMVVGDDKQLKPVVRISETEDEALLEHLQLEEEKHLYNYTKNSTFDIVHQLTTKDTSYLLNEHYRCEPSIVQFSNENFYSNQLDVKTSASHHVSGMKGIHVEGNPTYHNTGSKSAYNVLEIETVFEYLKTNQEDLKGRSIGIITPFRRQKNMLEDRRKQLMEEFQSHDFEKFLDNVEIGTVHTFQGDERDVILFSSVISEGVNTRTIDWVNEQRNLINVAITRAKTLFVMIGDLAFVKTTNGIFSDLACYIESLSGPPETIKINPIFGTFKSIAEKPIEAFSLRSILNPGEEQLYKELKTLIINEFPRFELGVKVRVADVIFVEPELVGQDIFRYSLMAHFDFVVFDSEKGTTPVLALELDGKTHRHDEKTKKNDEMKNTICDKHGLNIIRISTLENTTVTDMRLHIAEARGF